MLLPGFAHGRSYTQLNETYQGQTGDREGALGRGTAQGRGVERTWPGRDRGQTMQIWGGGDLMGQCKMNRDRSSENTKTTRKLYAQLFVFAITW